MKIKYIAVFVILCVLSVSGIAAQDAETIRIGALTRSEDNPHFVQMVRGYEFSAERYDVEILTSADSDEQVTIVDGWLANEDLDVLIVTPVSGDSLLPQLAQASAMGIPIINTDELVPANLIDELDLNIVTQVSSNNVRAGTVAANYAVANLPLGAEVALVEGIPGVQSSIDRVQGFILNAEQNGLRVVTSQPANWNTEDAYNVMLGITEQFPNIQGVFAANDTMGLGILQALEEIGRDDIIVISVDGIQASRDAVAAGSLEGTVSQFPFEMAVLAVEAAIKVAEGRPVAPFIESPVVLLTSDNLD